MTNFFYTVLNMSITSAIVIILVIIARMLIKRLPKKYSYLLWSVVAFRLCVPFSFKSLLSPFNIAKSEVLNTQSGKLTYVDEGNISALNTIISSSGNLNNSAKALTLTDILPYIWISVTVVILAISTARYFNLKQKLKSGKNFKENIYFSHQANTPFILGIIKPKIYIPSNTDKQYIDYIIAHEKYHLKRKDHIIKAFAFLLLAIHWFNPFCFIAFKLMNDDMEMSCDEKVIESHKNIKKIYSSALLSFAAKNNFPSSTPLCFIESKAKTRIKNVLKFKKPKKIIGIAAVMLCLIILSACASNPIDVKKQTDKISINSSSNVSAKQNNTISDDYILGNVIATNTGLSVSSIQIDGGNTVIKFDKKKLILNIETEEIEYSDKVEEKEYTRKEFLKTYATYKLDADEKYFSKTNSIKEVKYFKGKYYSSIIYFDNKPTLYNQEGVRIYAIMPNSKGFSETLSNEILKHISPNYDYEKYKSEAHYIYQKEYTSKNTISVYLRFYTATYSTRYGYVKDESAWISDAKIDLKLNNNSDYSVVKFTAAQDGADYLKSIKKMFSNDVYTYYFENNSNTSLQNQELTAQAMKALIENNKEIDINKSIETLLKRIGNINLIDTETDAYLMNLVDYGEYTVRYTFNAYKNGTLSEPQGKILQYAFLKIAGDEYIKTYAATGKEYFDDLTNMRKALQRRIKLTMNSKQNILIHIFILPNI